MSEHDALFSKLKNDKNKNNINVNEVLNDNSNRENDKKRKSDLNIDPMAKHLKNNYWSVLDNDENCCSDMNTICLIDKNSSFTIKILGNLILEICR